jgi:HD superfamily phosphohydrolase
LHGSFSYKGTSLICDPIHGYIQYTTHLDESGDEVTERDIIDHPWVQRLRRIHQVQSAFWVYPSAEHSRFQHSLGVMFMAGRFARQLYPTLKEIHPDVPSLPCVEELLRMTGLLHDLGHGPFSHFFDTHFLDEFGLTHEDISQAIIQQKLGPMIRRIRRSPSGEFQPGETLNPHHVAFLVKSPGEQKRKSVPPWVLALSAVFSGIYTADNLDYVLRDSYMAGVSTDIVDVDRLIYYTFLTPQGLTLHQAGVSALVRFLNAKIYLYMNMYFHRTTRAIDLHLKEIFRPTLEILFPHNPLKHLDAYQRLTEWYLLEEVNTWAHHTEDPARKKLGKKWKSIVHRNPRWKRAYEYTFSLSDYDDPKIFGMVQDARMLEEKLRANLPRHLKNIQLRVDLAHLDPRPINPLRMGDAQIYIFNESSNLVETEILKELFRFIPVRVTQCRIFTLNHEYDREIASAFHQIFQLAPSATLTTNI